MRIFNKPLLRYVGLRYWCLQYWGWALLVVIGSSHVGCWQEIHYEPEKTVQVEPPADQIPQQQEPKTQDPVSQKPEEKRAVAELVPATELILKTEPDPKSKQDAQSLQQDRPLDEETPGTTPIANSLTESSPPLQMSEPLALSTQAPSIQTPSIRAPSTLTSNSQRSGENNADTDLTRSTDSAWQLGSQWSLGAAIYAKGQPVKRYQPLLDRAESAAHLLDLKFEPLPYKIINDDPVATIVTYLLDDQGARLVEILDLQYGTSHAATLKLAIRSHLLLLVYSPSNMEKGQGLLSKEQFQTWIDQLVESAIGAQLPVSTWKPLIDQLRSLAPYADVKRAVFKLHKQVAAELRPVN